MKNEKLKIGDIVRIILYSGAPPFPNSFFLGKTSEIEEIYENIGYVKLKRWNYNVPIIFIKKTDNINDIKMDLNENIFKLS